MDIPTWEAFRALPLEELRPLMPKSIVCAIGGNRRAGIFAGIAPSTAEHTHWARQQMLDSFALLGRFGVRHAFLAAARSTEFKERGQHLAYLAALDGALADGWMLEQFAQRSMRPRLIGVDDEGFVARINERYAPLQRDDAAINLWFMYSPTIGSLWDWMCQGIAASGARSRAAAISALYGEMVPPVTLLIATGKPMVAADLMPPLLLDEAQGYWFQRPGYSFGEHELREILYDFTYMRRTWSADKAERATAALRDQKRWEHAGTLGLGDKLGPFWFPRPIE